MSTPQLQVDPLVVVRALQAEVERLNRVLDAVPPDVRIKAEESAVTHRCENCGCAKASG